MPNFLLRFHTGALGHCTKLFYQAEPGALISVRAPQRERQPFSPQHWRTATQLENT
jgi:hypothetical protein